MSHSAADLEEAAKDIAYVITHVGSSGGYKSIIMHLTPDEKGNARFTECTKTVEEVAKDYGFAYIDDGKLAVNMGTSSGIEPERGANQTTNYNVIWLMGNKPLKLPVRIPEDGLGPLLAGALRGAPERRASRRRTANTRPAARIA